MPTIYIDKNPYVVPAGKNLLEACLGLGFDLPYFCWHPALGSVGACRQCAVKVFKDQQDTRGRLVMSCMEMVRDGLYASVYDKSAKAFRAQIIEWLMTNHPHDCPVCDEGGSCHLQDMTVMTGHDYRRYHYRKRTYRNQYLGPLVHHEMNRCIQCYRCVRFYRDYAGGKDLNVFSAHNHVYFGREKDGVLESPFSGNLVEICPTGVFTDKTLKAHYTRKWDLTTAPSVCPHCSLGCNIIAGERYGGLRNIINRFNGEVNGYFLCDRGRYGYEFVNSPNRITQPLLRGRTVEAVDEDTLLGELKSIFMSGGQRLVGIGSPHASMESNFALQQLVGKENFYQGVTEDSAYLARRIVDISGSGLVHPASLKDIAAADAVLVLGEDVWNTAPVMALAVRQSVQNAAAAQAAQQLSLPVWNDLAVREFAQDQKGFLANCTVAPSPLDEISSCALHAAPDTIARMGFAIAHLLRPSLPEVPGIGEAEASKADTIARVLQSAKRPVIISGTSCCSDALIRAAYDIAASLDAPDRSVGVAYVLPECNSMGLAMMRAPSIEAMLSAKAPTTAGGEKSVDMQPDLTAIILENDLYRVLPEARVDAFFGRCKKVVALDVLNNRTTAKADVLIPAASFAEGDGTFVSNEGRAQRFFQVFIPAGGLIRESWKWLRKMRSLLTTAGNGQEPHPDQLLGDLERSFPQFEGISDAAPGQNFRIHGESIAREPHRYSGRTAMLANLAVSEPGPGQDGDSPLTFTMEGFQGIPPSPLIPFFWAPGWNSVQSVNKYQQEPGGALRGGDPGKRLFEKRVPARDGWEAGGGEGIPAGDGYFKDIPEAFTVRQQKWLLLPDHLIFGSGELSMYTKALRDLSPQPYAALSPQDARQLGAAEGTLICLVADRQEYFLPVKILQGVSNGMVLVPTGLPEIPVMNWGAWIDIKPQTQEP